MDNILKYRLVNGNIEEIPNYGIYEYFVESANNKLKLMASIYTSKYVLNYGTKDHYSLMLDIRKFSEEEDCWIGSVGDELNFFTSGDDIDSNQIQIIIDILLELKQYYNETGINKTIIFSGIPFYNSGYNEFNNNLNSSDIDNLISILNNMKLVRLEHISNR